MPSSMSNVMAELSPAAQAVVDAYGNFEPANADGMAAALRAATDHVIPEQMNRGLPDIRSEFLAIATELENHA